MTATTSSRYREDFPHATQPDAYSPDNIATGDATGPPDAARCRRFRTEGVDWHPGDRNPPGLERHMLSWFRARNDNVRKSRELYGAVVAQARQPAFYVHYGVPDTLKGRYEMHVIVLFQLLERLRVEAADTEELARVTLESFFTDVDDNMREIGIGDLSVPKKVKRAAVGFYERALAYRPALEAGDEAALGAALARFVHERETVDAGTSALAAHMMRQRHALGAAALDTVVGGGAYIAPTARA